MTFCWRFENAWKQGCLPRIEQELAGVPEAERSTLLRVLLALELEYRRLSHETLVSEHYQQRFPESAGRVRAVFAPVLGAAAPNARKSALSRQVTGTDLGPASPGPYGCPACLGRYRITPKLGTGGFGVVYKGYDPDLKRIQPVAGDSSHRDNGVKSVF
jgi:serine/threonine-protein kinase